MIIQGANMIVDLTGKTYPLWYEDKIVGDITFDKDMKATFKLHEDHADLYEKFLGLKNISMGFSVVDKTIRGMEITGVVEHDTGNTPRD
jgi:hypothetical protein